MSRPYLLGPASLPRYYLQGLGLQGFGMGATIVDSIEQARSSQAQTAANLNAAQRAQASGDSFLAATYTANAAASSAAAAANVGALAAAKRDQLQRESAALARGESPALANRAWGVTWIAAGGIAALGAVLLWRRRRKGGGKRRGR